MLDKAWRQIRANAFRSTSPLIANEARDFDAQATVRLARIQRQLRQQKFRFAPARGILIKKAGKKSKRPVVVAPIESRIVQRALLDVLQTVPQVRTELLSGFNFGGISGAGFGVPAAVAKAVSAANRFGYFVRTDIKSFFTQVPRERAVAVALEHVNDEDFRSLFQAATKTELEDIGRFSREELRLFPIAEEGVAQGSCLSPLLCNLLLADFDRLMNSRGVECIRYIDDFIVFAKDRRTATRAFSGALRHLAALGLSAYDPFAGSPEEATKAEHGRPVDGMTFLGCEITAISVRPSKQNRSELLSGIEDVLDSAIVAIKRHLRTGESIAELEAPTFASALVNVSNIIRGWGNTFQFCSDDRLMRDLDREIDKLISTYYAKFAKLADSPRVTQSQLRASLGVFALNDCKRDDSATSARSIALKAAQALSTGTKPFTN